RFATLRAGVWEFVASKGERYVERGDALDRETLLERSIAPDIESLERCFMLLDAPAAIEARVRDYLTSSGGQAPAPVRGHEGTGEGACPPYALARDYGAYLKACATNIPSLIAAAKENLDHG